MTDNQKLENVLGVLRGNFGGPYGILCILTVFSILTQSYTLNPLGQKQHKESKTNKLLQLLIRLANANIGRERRQNDANKQRARVILNLLAKTMDPEKVKSILRAGPEDDPAKEAEQVEIIQAPEIESVEDKTISTEQAKIVETELTSALTGSSALMKKPYVQHKGKNDFLVMHDTVSDPFVTVIPNAMYYDIEKKCVNWLDDCSLDGIRAKLFQAMRSPY